MSLFTSLCLGVWWFGIREKCISRFFSPLLHDWTVWKRSITAFSGSSVGWGSWKDARFLRRQWTKKGKDLYGTGGKRNWNQGSPSSSGLEGNTWQVSPRTGWWHKKEISLGQKEEPRPYLVGQEEAWMQVTGLRRGQAGPFTSSAFGRDRSLNSILLWYPRIEHSDCCLSQNFTSDFHAIFFHRKKKKKDEGLGVCGPQTSVSNCRACFKCRFPERTPQRV